ncbi:uncharacterized protein BDR25DRAFT_207498 [Lindgomyces ingoldianus]|uniref:Uncharacterized protein n=1 Tax=Lindgomyces ingoldianus TaxID=673940 RepID=A0ACB6RF87_9PLEO|nr:uncharacterized protein BDR25DRAFT_207498 [Lindgomyces ingoldianus]KAF2478009.1 hypothetical protein BDR25DRAFT_207498 [Lindgomyces ingoldianus]
MLGVSDVSQRNESEGGSSIRPLLRASTTFYDRVITDWWWWELFSLAVSFLSVGAIVGMLLFYRGKKQPDHVFFGITLNAYISVFSAIAKAALILPVSEGIGQLKWMWFRKGSKLLDFFTFDSASRGPWGSLMLLWVTKCRHVAALGAIITILALAFEPFFQQLVSFPPRDVVLGSGTVSIASTYHIDNQGIAYVFDGGELEEGKSMKLVIDEAVFTSNFAPTPAPSVCPTGRCTWSPYTSLGVCQKCQDISSFLKYSCKNHTTLLFPHRGTSVDDGCGYVLNDTILVGTHGYRQKYSITLSTFAVNRTIRMASPADHDHTTSWNSTIFHDAAHPILDVYIAYSRGGEAKLRPNATAVLLECLFYWCAQTFEASYGSGVLQEVLLNTSAIQSGILDHNHGNQSRSEPFTLNVGGKSFGIIENTTDFLGESIYTSLPTRLDGSSPGLWQFMQTPPYDLNPHFSNLAVAVTNRMRSQAKDTETVSGLALGTENFVYIRWVWISLPGSLLIGSFIFVCAAIFKSRRAKAVAWKSSALATLLHGLSKEAQGQFNPHLRQSEVEALSQKLRVKLSSEEDGSTRLILA